MIVRQTVLLKSVFYGNTAGRVCKSTGLALIQMVDLHFRRCQNSGMSNWVQLQSARRFADWRAR